MAPKLVVLTSDTQGAIHPSSLFVNDMNGQFKSHLRMTFDGKRSGGFRGMSEQVKDSNSRTVHLNVFSPGSYLR